MSINRSDIIRGILIGCGVFICSILLLITLYLLYRYRRESFYFNDRIEPENERRSTLIEQLMRKSLELAKTAEQVADDKEKRIINMDF
jgi:hypothetical protein